MCTANILKRARLLWQSSWCTVGRGFFCWTFHCKDNERLIGQSILWCLEIPVAIKHYRARRSDVLLVPARAVLWLMYQSACLHFGHGISLICSDFSTTFASRYGPKNIQEKSNEIITNITLKLLLKQLSRNQTNAFSFCSLSVLF